MPFTFSVVMEVKATSPSSQKACLDLICNHGCPHGADPSRRAGPEDVIPLEKGVRIMRDCAVALHDLRAAGVVLEDLKPANVLLSDKDGMTEAVLTDFGVSKFLRKGLPSTQPTQQQLSTHGPRGTSAYM
jgi:serine/threonine protein kinase